MDMNMNMRRSIFFPCCYMLLESMIILLSDILLKVVDHLKLAAQTVKFPSALASKSSFKVSDSRCLKSFTTGSLTWTILTYPQQIARSAFIYDGNFAHSLNALNSCYLKPNYPLIVVCLL